MKFVRLEEKEIGRDITPYTVYVNEEHNLKVKYYKKNAVIETLHIKKALIDEFNLLPVAIWNLFDNKYTSPQRQCLGIKHALEAAENIALILDTKNNDTFDKLKVYATSEKANEIVAVLQKIYSNYKKK